MIDGGTVELLYRTKSGKPSEVQLKLWVWCSQKNCFVL